MNLFLERKVQGTGRQLLGISGTFAGGKDLLSDHLADEHAFMHVSTGGILRKVLAQRGITAPSRELLLETSSALHVVHGPSAMVDIALEDYRKKRHSFCGGLVVSGLRHPTEAVAVKEKGGTLAYVDAPVDIRFVRSLNRGRSDGVHELAVFAAQEQRELEGSVQGGPNLLAIKAMADVELLNDGSNDSFMVQSHAAFGIQVR